MIYWMDYTSVAVTSIYSQPEFESIHAKSMVIEQKLAIT